MASLDKFEGDLLEIVGVIVLIVIALVIWKLYGAAQGLSSFGALVQKIVDALKNLFSGGAPKSKFGTGPDWVYTGTDVGNWGDGFIGVNDPSTVNADGGYGSEG